MNQMRSSYEVVTANRRELNSDAEGDADSDRPKEDFDIDLPLGEE